MAACMVCRDAAGRRGLPQGSDVRTLTDATAAAAAWVSEDGTERGANEAMRSVDDCSFRDYHSRDDRTLTEVSR